MKIAPYMFFAFSNDGAIWLENLAENFQNYASLLDEVYCLEYCEIAIIPEPKYSELKSKPYFDHLESLNYEKYEDPYFMPICATAWLWFMQEIDTDTSPSNIRSIMGRDEVSALVQKRDQSLQLEFLVSAREQEAVHLPETYSAEEAGLTLISTADNKSIYTPVCRFKISPDIWHTQTVSMKKSYEQLLNDYSDFRSSINPMTEHEVKEYHAIRNKFLKLPEIK
ncbi:MAG: hypothetical protein R3C11_12325 [Planctomycetaceae bacterium]